MSRIRECEKLTVELWVKYMPMKCLEVPARLHVGYFPTGAEMVQYLKKKQIVLVPLFPVFFFVFV